jgi:hypothetical protein
MLQIAQSPFRAKKNPLAVKVRYVDIFNVDIS